MRKYRVFGSLLISIVVSACVQQSSEISFTPGPQRVDFSGFWEKNYQRSDNIDSKFQLFLYDVQRSINVGANRGNLQGPTLSAGRASAGLSNEALTGLARITEDITSIALLDVSQDDNSINIDREDNFALRCEYYQERFVVTENAFGSEVCGWDGEQLIFQITMLDGLSIYHQVTMAENKRELNITTTVRSSAVSSAFTISNYYQRYSPIISPYDCIFTLSRNNVCRQGGL